MAGLLLAAMLATTAQPPPSAPPDRGNLVFARGQTSGWSMQAFSVVDNDPSGPTIDRMMCEIKRDGLNVTTWRQGEISFAFGSTAPGRFHTDLRRLVIDDVAYEAQARAHGALTDRYTDVEYPESQHVYPPTQWFSLWLRRQGGELWLGLHNLDNELLEARRLRLGFARAAGAALQWIEVPLAGLGDALGWCHAAMTSPNALRLHLQ